MHSNDPAREAFLATLRRHGFYTAAENWRERWVDHDHAARSWDNYPACLDAYPAILRPVTEKGRPR